MRGEPRVYEFRRRTRFGEMWYYPRDRNLDVAIAPLSAGELGEATNQMSIGVVPLTRRYNRYLQAKAAGTHQFEEVLFVGYPEGLWDPSTGFPIVRRGVTATPLQSDYQHQPTFLVDGAVYPGCSGGPVVIVDRQLSVIPEKRFFDQYTPQQVVEEDLFAFLGMITDTIAPRGGAPLNLGRVLKADKLFEVVREYETLTRRSA